MIDLLTYFVACLCKTSESHLEDARPLVSYDIFLFMMEGVKPVFPACTHDGGYAYAAKPKHSHFEGGIDASSAIPHPVSLFVDPLSMASPSATSTEFDSI